LLLPGGVGSTKFYFIKRGLKIKASFHGTKSAAIAGRGSDRRVSSADFR
jgi:hypothetical protein